MKSSDTFASRLEAALSRCREQVHRVVAAESQSRGHAVGEIDLVTPVDGAEPTSIVIEEDDFSLRIDLMLKGTRRPNVRTIGPSGERTGAQSARDRGAPPLPASDGMPNARAEAPAPPRQPAALRAADPRVAAGLSPSPVSPPAASQPQAARVQAAPPAPQPLVDDPDLLRVLTSWRTLPPAVRSAISQIVSTHAAR